MLKIWLYVGLRRLVFVILRRKGVIIKSGANPVCFFNVCLSFTNYFVCELLGVISIGQAQNVS